MGYKMKGFTPFNSGTSYINGPSPLKDATEAVEGVKDKLSGVFEGKGGSGKGPKIDLKKSGKGPSKPTKPTSSSKKTTTTKKTTKPKSTDTKKTTTTKETKPTKETKTTKTTKTPSKQEASSIVDNYAEKHLNVDKEIFNEKSIKSSKTPQNTENITKAVEDKSWWDGNKDKIQKYADTASVVPGPIGKVAGVVSAGIDYSDAVRAGFKGDWDTAKQEFLQGTTSAVFAGIPGGKNLSGIVKGTAEEGVEAVLKKGTKSAASAVLKDQIANTGPKSQTIAGDPEGFNAYSVPGKV
tara:strand:- start:292 stop:1176 length:885 start_codon:yes stop_codon:yes gene_type:complete